MWAYAVPLPELPGIRKQLEARDVGHTDDLPSAAFECGSHFNRISSTTVHVRIYLGLGVQLRRSQDSMTGTVTQEL